MDLRVLCLALLGLTLASVASAGEPALTSEPKTITIEDGPRVQIEVEAGELQVPENRRSPGRRRVTLPYYRLKSSAARPAAPIFLLAGGPGSSWLDQLEKNRENFDEVAFYRTIADVVVFDQRGGGRSLPQMHCTQTAQLPADQPLDLDRLRSTARTALAACRDQWQSEGVDLAAYNTVENAADVDALRQALGYRTMALVGGSYGSHLALQVMRLYPDTVERAVLFGIEGPDHTWDDPDGRLATLARIAAAAERSDALSVPVPEGGLLKALARVLKRLEAKPQTVTAGEGAKVQQVVVDAASVRRVAAYRAGRRSTPLAWPEFILAMDRDDFSLAGRGALEHRNIRLADPMHYSMDCASGITEQRRRRYRDSPAAALLGDINFEYESLCDLWPHRDLGDGFRANVVSDIPTLILHGNWDMSTPIENAREVARSLSNAQFVEVIGGGHGALYNLYEHWPPMHDRMRTFLSGQATDFPAQVQMPAVVFSPVPSH